MKEILFKLNEFNNYLVAIKDQIPDYETDIDQSNIVEIAQSLLKLERNITVIKSKMARTILFNRELNSMSAKVIKKQ